MDWMRGLESIAFIITLVLLWLLAKEIKKSIKASNNGEKNDRCDLD